MTTDRKNLFLSLIQELCLYTKQQPYEIHHLITGIQGIGKSCSLWLFAYLFQQVSPQINQQIKVVLIPDCVLLSIYKGNYILKQMMLQFPGQIPKDLLNSKWGKQIDFIKKFLGELESERRTIVYLMVDQINDASGEGNMILDTLKGLAWTFVIYTESAHNYVNVNKEYIGFLKHNLISLVSFEEFSQIIEIERSGLNLNVNKNENYLEIIKEITEYTALNPREAIKVLDSEGKTIQEKIKFYKRNRFNELATLILLRKFETMRKKKFYIFLCIIWIKWNH